MSRELRSTTAEVRPQVGDIAPDIEVVAAGSGERTPLSAYWSTGPALLVFLRHLGCSFCREQVALALQLEAELRALGASAVLITLGTPEASEPFCRERGIAPPFHCVCDPAKDAYRAYGLARAHATELLTPHVVSRGFQAALHGHFAGMPKGDPFQMPGAFIVNSAGGVVYAHRHRDAADNPPNEVLLAGLRSIGESADAPG